VWSKTFEGLSEKLPSRVRDEGCLDQVTRETKGGQQSFFQRGASYGEASKVVVKTSGCVELT
jgi:hypothetical protein